MIIRTLLNLKSLLGTISLAALVASPLALAEQFVYRVPHSVKAISASGQPPGEREEELEVSESLKLSDATLPSAELSKWFYFSFNSVLEVLDSSLYGEGEVSWKLKSQVPVGLRFENGVLSGDLFEDTVDNLEVEVRINDHIARNTYAFSSNHNYYEEDGIVYCLNGQDGVKFNLNGKPYRVVFTLADAKRFAENACTSNIYNMSNINFGSYFNKDISHWDMSNVYGTVNMFKNAHRFNQPIGNWKFRNLQSAESMFENARAFNQPIGDWPTGRITNMSRMFKGASAFNQNISGWDVSNVGTFEYMFDNARAFNQPLDSWELFPEIKTLKGVFRGASSFNQDISNWDTSAVRTFEFMFQHATNFNQPVDFEFHSANTLEAMFEGAKSFNQDISQWDLRDFTNVEKMLQGADSFNQDLSRWCVPQIYPNSFSSTLSKEKLPKWGTCP